MARWLVLFAVGCGLYSGERPPDEPVASSHVEIQDVPVAIWIHRIDLVFVIDTTPAMAPLRERVVANMADFAGAIAQDAISDDLAIFAVAADPASNGALLGAPIHLVSLPAGGFRADFDGELADRLSALVPAFTATSSQPLAQLATALENHAELRGSDAGLVVVMITNQDDASPGAVDDYFARVVAHTGTADRLRIAHIGVQSASRLGEFLDLGQEGTWLDIESIDWSPVMLALTPLSTLGLPCLQAPPAKPRECAASAFYQGVETLLPMCDVAISKRPCLELRAEPSCELSGISPRPQWLAWPEVGTHVETQCVVSGP